MRFVTQEELEVLQVQVMALRDRVSQLELHTLPIEGVLNAPLPEITAGGWDTQSNSWQVIKPDPNNPKNAEYPSMINASAYPGVVNTRQGYIPDSRYLYPVFQEPTAEEVEAMIEKLRSMEPGLNLNVPVAPCLQEMVFDGWPVVNVVRFLLERLNVPKADWPPLPGSGEYGPFVPGSFASREDAGLPRVGVGTGQRPACRVRLEVENHGSQTEGE